MNAFKIEFNPVQFLDATLNNFSMNVVFIINSFGGN